MSCRRFRVYVVGLVLFWTSCSGGFAWAGEPATDPEAKPAEIAAAPGDGTPSFSPPAIRRALAQPIKVQWDKKPLHEVTQDLRRLLAVPVGLDKKALEDAGIATDTPITFSASGVSARSALKLLFRELNLAYVTRDEAILITTPEEAESMMETKVYDVADLVTPEPEQDKSECLENLSNIISSCIRPTMWDSVGGPGCIAPFSAIGIKAIVISQTEEVHEEVDALLTALRKVRHGVPGKSLAPEKTGPSTEKAAAVTNPPEPKVPAWESAVRRALEDRRRFAFQNRPLRAVVAAVRKALKIQVVLDTLKLKEAGIDADVPVTFAKEGRTGVILDQMLRELGLTWTVADEALMITTLEEAVQWQIMRVYDVSDLPAFRNERGEAVPDFDGLIETITRTVAPATWEADDGPGRISVLQQSGVWAIIVSQTWQIHEEIATVLAGLRKVRARPMTKEDIDKLPPAPKEGDRTKAEREGRRASRGLPPAATNPLIPSP